MNRADIAKMRLQNQCIGRPQCSGPKELLLRMGALQAQDYDMVKWAMGIRLPGSTLKAVEEAITSGGIIRTHILRPTWHFVAADNLRWMLALTAPRIKTAMRTRHKYLGLNKKAIAKSNNIIKSTLFESGQLTRKKLVAKLEKAGFKNKDNLASHLLLRAELDGVICSGATSGNSYTYALMDKRVSQAWRQNREEALAKLAQIYFGSHGPATIEDFSWWSGLTITDARHALEMISNRFESFEHDKKEYWFSGSARLSGQDDDAYLLPAYDEFIISYKDRSAVIHEEQYSKAISKNGIFWPVVVYNEQVVGTWKRSVQKGGVTVKPVFFTGPTRLLKEKVQSAAELFARFLGKSLKIEF